MISYLFAYQSYNKFWEAVGQRIVKWNSFTEALYTIGSHCTKTDYNKYSHTIDCCDKNTNNKNGEDSFWNLKCLWLNHESRVFIVVYNHLKIIS